MSGKLYAFAAIVLVALLAYVKYQNLQIELGEVRASLTASDQKLVAAQNHLATVRFERDAEAKARAVYLQQLRASQNEIETLGRDLADGRRELHISAVCTDRLLKADDTGRVEAATAFLDAGAERAYLRLRQRIDEVTAWAAMCHATIAAWGE